jgi:hypothetical protein
MRFWADTSVYHMHVLILRISMQFSAFLVSCDAKSKIFPEILCFYDPEILCFCIVVAKTNEICIRLCSVGIFIWSFLSNIDHENISVINHTSFISINTI